MSTGVAWIDGRSRAAGTGKAASCGSGGGGGVAYEARGYKQGWADGKAGKTVKSTVQIKPKTRVARFWLVYFKVPSVLPTDEDSAEPARPTAWRLIPRFVLGANNSTESLAHTRSRSRRASVMLSHRRLVRIYRPDPRRIGWC